MAIIPNVIIMSSTVLREPDANSKLSIPTDKNGHHNLQSFKESTNPEWQPFVKLRDQKYCLPYGCSILYQPACKVTRPQLDEQPNAKTGMESSDRSWQPFVKLYDMADSLPYGCSIVHPQYQVANGLATKEKYLHENLHSSRFEIADKIEPKIKELHQKLTIDPVTRLERTITDNYVSRIYNGLDDTTPSIIAPEKVLTLGANSTMIRPATNRAIKKRRKKRQRMNPPFTYRDMKAKEKRKQKKLLPIESLASSSTDKKQSAKGNAEKEAKKLRNKTTFSRIQDEEITFKRPSDFTLSMDTSERKKFRALYSPTAYLNSPFMTEIRKSCVGKSHV